MVEAATRREISRRRDSLSPNAVTDRLSALRVSKKAVATPPRRRRTPGAADVPSPRRSKRDRGVGERKRGNRGGRGKPPDGRRRRSRRAQRKVRPEPYYSQPVQ